MAGVEPKRRKDIRLEGFDYSQAGAYFLTLCTQDRLCILGEVTGQEVRPSIAEEIVAATWQGLPDFYPSAELGPFVIMPNHVHGLIILSHKPVGAGLKPALPRPLSEVIRGFKTFSARQINEAEGTLGRNVWQRNYYEHVIRGQEDYNRVAEYILDNPRKWAEDELDPERQSLA